MKKIDSLKSSLNSYLDEIVGYTITYLYDNKLENNNILNSLFELLEKTKEIVNNTRNYDELLNIQTKIYNIEERIKSVLKSSGYVLTNREKDLVSRGYDESSVKALCFFTEKQAQEIAKIIYDQIVKDCKKVSILFVYI